MPLRKGRPPEDGPRLGAELDQPPRLQSLQSGHSGPIKLPTLREHVDHLPAGHPARARRPTQGGDQFAACLWVRVRVGFGQDLEGAGLQGIAGQNRRGLVELLMGRGFAPSQIVVVHRRKVVMNQRIGVQHLNRGRRACRAGLRHGEHCGALHHQERPQPLAATQGRIAHSVCQARLGTLRFRQQRLQGGFHHLGNPRHCGGQVRIGHCHRALLSDATPVPVHGAPKVDW